MTRGFFNYWLYLLLNERKMKKVIRLTESELVGIVKKILSEKELEQATSSAQKQYFSNLIAPFANNIPDDELQRIMSDETGEIPEDIENPSIPVEPRSENGEKTISFRDAKRIIKDYVCNSANSPEVVEKTIVSLISTIFGDGKYLNKGNKSNLQEENISLEEFLKYPIAKGMVIAIGLFLLWVLYRKIRRGRQERWCLNPR